MLKAAEHHHFTVSGRALLFNVAELTVIDSCELDARILEASSAGTATSSIIRRLGDLPAKHVRQRIRALRKHRFLLTRAERPKKTQNSQPTTYATFMVNVSQRCNLTCPYCYVKKGLFDYKTKPIARMEAATADSLVRRIYDNFPGLETYGFHFYGGEPLMNFEAIRRVVAAAERTGAETGTKTGYHITTNGTLLTREIADFMDLHRFTVYFSIDGDETSHDELRKYVNGKGSFKDVDRNLAYLKQKRGVHLIGSSVVRKGFTLENAIDALQAHGATQCKAEHVRLRDEEALALKGTDKEGYIQDIQGLVRHYIESLNAGRKPMDFRLSSKILQLLTKTKRTFFCPAGERMFGVSANGEIYPCALHVGRSQSKLGDLDIGIDIEKQRAFRQKFSPDAQMSCQQCWARHLCGGGCSAMIDRFGHEDCRSLRAEAEAAIAIYQHFMQTDSTKLYGLVSPKIAKWVAGDLNAESELRLESMLS